MGEINKGEPDWQISGISQCLEIAVLQPPQSGTHSHLAFATLHLPILSILSVAFLKLTASCRPSAPPSGSPKCLRFGHWVTLCTLNIHLLTYYLLALVTLYQVLNTFIFSLYTVDCFVTIG